MLEYATIENVLQFHKVPCQVITSRTGGGYCDYILNLGQGTTIKKLQSRVNELSVTIGQPVSIALENLNVIFRIKDAGQTVYNYFDYSNYLDTTTAGGLAFGVSPRGEYIQHNLFTMPHLLVAGATGSGKSVFLHSAIVSLAICGGVAFKMIDLKRVELSIYDGCPFMDGDTVTDAITAEKTLREEVREMENRYILMERHNVRNYKDLPQDCQLKARVIVIDELCDLMLNRETRRSVENSIVRIAQLGRAAGCHLILATQRPSTNVITGLIKANIPCQLAFMTANSVDSRVIGCKGAENLNGRGDGLLSMAGSKELERLQAFYLSDDILNKFIDGVKAQAMTQTQTRNQTQKQTRRGLFGRLFG